MKLEDRLRTACSPESPLGKLFSDAADRIAELEQELGDAESYITELAQKPYLQQSEASKIAWANGRAEAEAERDAEKARVAFLNEHTNLEITWGDIDGWEDDCQWRVHSRNGGRSDLEWKRIGYGPTVESAIDAARAALKGSDHEA